MLIKRKKRVLTIARMSAANRNVILSIESMKRVLSIERKERVLLIEETCSVHRKKETCHVDLRMFQGCSKAAELASTNL